MLKAQIKDVDSRLEHLYDAVETGKVALGDLAPRIASQLSKRSNLLAVMAEAKEAIEVKPIGVLETEQMAQYVKNLKSVLGSASIMEQKAFLKSFVRRIDVSPSEVAIHYTLPMPPLYVDKETIGVLDFKPNGGRYWI